MAIKFVMCYTVNAVGWWDGIWRQRGCISSSVGNALGQVMENIMEKEKLSAILSIGICEDIRSEAEWLEKQIQEWGREQNCKIEILLFESAEQFWFHYKKGELDALFLDIKMPGEDGMTLAKKLRDQGDMLSVVFVTGEQEYIAEGYEVEAIHYLIKPVRAEKLHTCMDRICQRLDAMEPYLLLKTADSVTKILQKDIYKIEVFAHTLVYTTKQGSYEVVSSMKEVEQDLQEGWFVKCYRGIVVGIRHIETIGKSSLWLKIEGAESMEVPVSRRLYGEVNQAFITFWR